MALNQDILEGKWKQLTGKMKAQWGKLTDDDLDVAKGNAEYLVGRLQERYGYGREKAEEEVQRFQKQLH